METERQETETAEAGSRGSIGSVLETMAVELQAKNMYLASLPGGPDCKHRRYPEWRDLPEADRVRWRQCVSRAEAIAAATVHIDRLPNADLRHRADSAASQPKGNDR